MDSKISWLSYKNAPWGQIAPISSFVLLRRKTDISSAFETCLNGGELLLVVQNSLDYFSLRRGNLKLIAMVAESVLIASLLP